jgi:AraC-like DNA-binding protein
MVPVLERVTLSTRSIPARERIERWRDAMVRSAFPLDVEPLAGESLAGTATLYAMGQAVITHGAVSGALHRNVGGNTRTDSVLIVLNRVAAVVVSGARGDVTVGDGEPFVLSGNFTGEARIKRARFTSVCLPRQFIAPFIAKLDSAICSPLDRNGDALRLLKRYLQLIDRHPPRTAPAAAIAGEHVRDLVALAISPTRDDLHRSENGGLAAARLAALKADCLARIDEDRLTLDRLAASASLAPRTIRALFAKEGTTFTDFIRNARLDRAARMLANSKLDRLQIATIAYDCGFSDVSYFNRCFRNRYDRTPGEFRAAMRETPIASFFRSTATPLAEAADRHSIASPANFLSDGCDFDLKSRRGSG